MLVLSANAERPLHTKITESSDYFEKHRCPRVMIHYGYKITFNHSIPRFQFKCIVKTDATFFCIQMDNNKVTMFSY